MIQVTIGGANLAEVRENMDAFLIATRGAESAPVVVQRTPEGPIVAPKAPKAAAEPKAPAAPKPPGRTRKGAVAGELPPGVEVNPATGARTVDPSTLKFPVLPDGAGLPGGHDGKVAPQPVAATDFLGDAGSGTAPKAAAAAPEVQKLQVMEKLQAAAELEYDAQQHLTLGVEAFKTVFNALGIAKAKDVKPEHYGSIIKVCDAYLNGVMSLDDACDTYIA